MVLTYRPFGAADVQGRWLVIGLLNRNQEAFSTPIEGTRITANFKQDGQLQGNAGCNSYSGSYEVQGNTISIGDSAATQKECAEPRGLMRQENRYFQALNQAVTFEVEGRNLGVLRRQGYPPGLLPPGRLTAVSSFSCRRAATHHTTGLDNVPG